MQARLRRIFQTLVIPSVPAILLIVNQMLAAQFSDARTLADEAEQAHLLRGQLSTILSTHQDIEIGQRSYVLTGEPVFLEPYARAEARLPGEFAALDTLAAGRPDVQAAVGEMRALARRSTPTAISRGSAIMRRSPTRSMGASTRATRAGATTSPTSAACVPRAGGGSRPT
jgi:CHASE3 domain sensor protein